VYNSILQHELMAVDVFIRCFMEVVYVAEVIYIE
jgi:hypothetical protein